MFSNTRIKQAAFLALFIFLGFIAMQVPFSQLVGANIKFNLFDFYGPIVGGFIGSTLGVVTVLIMQVINWAWHGFATDGATLIRFLPVIFSVLYFARRSRWILLVPAVCMIAFWAHPEGRMAWTYPLYWFIPIVMYFLHDKFIFARALGATFTAHAVGGALWIWVFNMKAALWIGLMPVVWKERGLMAIGITVTYVAFNYLLRFVVNYYQLNIPFLRTGAHSQSTTK